MSLQPDLRPRDSAAASRARTAGGTLLLAAICGLDAALRASRAAGKPATVSNHHRKLFAHRKQS